MKEERHWHCGVCGWSADARLEGGEWLVATSDTNALQLEFPDSKSLSRYIHSISRPHISKNGCDYTSPLEAT